MSNYSVNENVQFFYKSVSIYIKTYEEAVIAKNSGVLSVIVLFDKEYNMANLNLVLSVKQNLKLHCIAQARENNTLETFLLNGCGVDIIHKCIKNADLSSLSQDDTSNSKTNLLQDIDSLPQAINAIHAGYSIVKSGNENSSVSELNDIYCHVNKKIHEFHKFKNINSINKFSKEIGINRKLVENVSNLRRLPIPYLAEGDIKNHIDAVNIMRHGYDGIILSNTMFNTSDPQLVIKLIVNSVQNFSNNAKILESCTALYTTKNK